MAGKMVVSSGIMGDIVKLRGCRAFAAVPLELQVMRLYTQEPQLKEFYL